MSFSDKISWVGGMMGLFTGFSVISGLEIMYWLWFKVLLHAKEVEPVDEDLQKQFDELKNENEKEINSLKMELQEVKMKLKGCQSGDPKAGAFFDAIFIDPEAKESLEILLQLKNPFTYNIAFTHFAVLGILRKDRRSITLIELGGKFQIGRNKHKMASSCGSWVSPMTQVIISYSHHH